MTLRTLLAAAALFATSMFSGPAQAADSAKPAVLFKNVRIFNGTSDQLSGPSNVLVSGNTISAISTGDIADAASQNTVVINGDGKTLMPGLIDAHAHIMFESVSQIAILTSDIGFVNIAAARAAQGALQQGFTAIRDMGGPSFGLKRAIDLGIASGPRIWSSGAFISQTGGHGDFRLPNEMPAAPDAVTYSERVNAGLIADDPDMVRKRAREQLALGASQIKLMAGGGVSSTYDPLDVTQYTVPELKAAVEAAENWGTYVTVHAYTPKAVQQALEAGVKAIEHGQLLDDATVKLMAEKGTWWCLQPFTDEFATPFPDGSANRVKQLTMFSGTDNAFALAKKYKIKTGWGTDVLFDAKLASTRGAQLASMTKWYTPFEVLKMATKDNADLLALSGERSPYAGRLGVVETGALADLLLVDGDPIADIGLLKDPARTMLVIMKDGIVFKDLTQH